MLRQQTFEAIGVLARMEGSTLEVDGVVMRSFSVGPLPGLSEVTALPAPQQPVAEVAGGAKTRRNSGAAGSEEPAFFPGGCDRFRAAGSIRPHEVGGPSVYLSVQMWAVPISIYIHRTVRARLPLEVARGCAGLSSKQSPPPRCRTRGDRRCQFPRSRAKGGPDADRANLAEGGV